MNEEDRNLFELILDVSNYVLLIVNEEGMILHGNRIARERYGIAEDDLPEKNIAEIIVSPSPMNLLQSVTAIQKAPDIFSQNFQIRNNHGELIPIKVSVASLSFSGKKANLLMWSPTELINSDQLEIINQLLARLSSSDAEKIEFSELIGQLTNILIPEITDACGIFLFDRHGVTIKRVISPETILTNPLIYQWFETELINDEADGLPDVLLTGKSKLISEVNPIRQAAQAGITSYMIIPLIANQQTIGALSMIQAESGRHFDHSSVILAENIAIQLAPYLYKRLLVDQEGNYAEDGTGEASGAQEPATEVNRSEAMLQTLFRISSKLNATLNVDEILDTLAQEAIRMVDGESGFAGLRTAEGMRVKKYFYQGQEIPFEHTWAVGDGIPGWVLKYKVPYGTSDAENDPLILRDLTVNKDVRSVICTPILDTVGEVIAYFDIRNKKTAEGFSINDQEMLLTLAPVASIAIQNALAYQQRMTTLTELEKSAKQYQELAASLEAAREEERINVARELHDQLGQSLTGIKYDLAWLSSQIGRTDETLEEKTKGILAQLNQTIQTVRQIAAQLRPGMLEDLGLAASIEWQVRDFEKRTGIQCSILLLDDDEKLPSEKSLAIYRILQEGLTNVAQHSETQQVEVSLRRSGDLLKLELHDHGKGISAKAISDSHSLGIMGMRERAQQLGGTFDVHGDPQNGTTLIVSFPISVEG